MKYDDLIKEEFTEHPTVCEIKNAIQNGLFVVLYVENEEIHSKVRKSKPVEFYYVKDFNFGSKDYEIIEYFVDAIFSVKMSLGRSNYGRKGKNWIIIMIPDNPIITIPGQNVQSDVSRTRNDFLDRIEANIKRVNEKIQIHENNLMDKGSMSWEKEMIELMGFLEQYTTQKLKLLGKNF